MKSIRIITLLLLLTSVACGQQAEDNATAVPLVTPSAVTTATALLVATATPVQAPTGMARLPTAPSTPTLTESTSAPTVTLQATQSEGSIQLTASQLEQHVDQLLASMTLEEKVGQLFMVYFTGPTLSPALNTMITNYHVGGLVLFQIADNLQSLPQTADLLNAAQTAALTHGAQIPLLVAVDQEGGPVTRLPTTATLFPSNMAVGATGSLDLARQMAQVTATELKALGINMNLAPVVDVNDNPNNPVIGLRSFGSAPALVAALGSAMIESYQQNGIVATAKHFPGHGNTDVDSHFGLPVVGHDRAHLDAVELSPFRAAIASGVDAIMTAHVLFPAIVQDTGLPATLSPAVLQGLLREELNFQRLIVSDSLTMGALDQRYGVNLTTELAFRAGADILAFGADYGHTPEEQPPAYHHLLAQIQQDAALQQQLDQSVRRILQTKVRYGLFDRPPVDVAAIPQIVGVEAHRALARQIAQQSITLLKADPQQLPLSPDASVFLILSPGNETLESELMRCHNGVQTLYVDIDPTADQIAWAVQQAATTAVTVVATTNARSHPGQVQLVDALRASPLIVAALQTPYDLLSFPQVPTYLATYGNVPVSLQALANVLCGQAAPTGKLPVDLPGLFARGAGQS